MIAVRTMMNPAAQSAQAKLRLGLRRTIRAVRVHVRRRVGLVQKPIEFLAVMHTRVRHVILPDQLVLGIRIHVVLVAVEALAVLLGPARVLVFLPVFRRVLLPRLRCLASLHLVIRRGYCAAWEPARSWHQPSGRHAQCSPWPPNAGQSAQTAFQPDRPSQASPGTATTSCRPECRPRCRAPETA